MKNEYKKGEVVIAQGEPQENMFIVQKGSFERVRVEVRRRRRRRLWSINDN